MSTVTKVAIAVVESAGHVLVGIRPGGVPLSGKAEFPGGKCLPDETTRFCAVRECREETGLMVIPRQHLITTTHEYDHGVVELDFWRCALSPDVQDLSEPLKPFRWVPFRELRYLDFPEGNRLALEVLFARAAPTPDLDDEQNRLLDEFAAAFADVPRPRHFTDRGHCDECARHDDALQAVGREGLRLKHVGNPAWDPVCFITVEAWRYLLPALTRVLVRHPGQYFEEFLLHLRQERFQALSESEQAALAAFLTGYRDRIARQIEAREGEWSVLADCQPPDCPTTRIDGKLAELYESVRS